MAALFLLLCTVVAVQNSCSLAEVCTLLSVFFVFFVSVSDLVNLLLRLVVN